MGPKSKVTVETTLEELVEFISNKEQKKKELEELETFISLFTVSSRKEETAISVGSELELCKKELKETSTALRDLNKQYDYLNTKHSNLYKECDIVSENYDALARTHRNLQEENKNLHKRNNKISTELMNLQLIDQSYENLAKQYEELERSCDYLKTTLTKANATIKVLELLKEEITAYTTDKYYLINSHLALTEIKGSLNRFKEAEKGEHSNGKAL